MKEFLLKAVLFVCGVLLLPFCAASTWALASLVGSVQPESLFALPVAAWAFVSGFGLWLFVFFALPRPVITYVLSHELTHALWAALMGAEVRRIRLSNQSGSVVLSKSNILITLAPYFFPLYTIIVIVVYYLLSLFLDTGQYEWIWLFLVGLTWAFHLTFTASTLLDRQTDILEYGHVFSLTFIYLLNILGIGAWVVLVTSATMKTFAILLLHDSQAVWTWIMELFF